MSTTPIWARPAPGARQPRFTRERIAEAALAIADAEGIDALSMRRLADQLGAGTMTLYHYVPSKRDLLALMKEAIFAEIVVPEGEFETGWRAGLTQIAHRVRAAWRRHPWALIALHDVYMGPNLMRVFEQQLAAVAKAPIDVATKLELIDHVNDYVLGSIMRENAEEPVDVKVVDDVADFMAAQLATGEFPIIQQLIAGDEPVAFVRKFVRGPTADERFERGLRRLLDGIAVQLDTRSSS